MHENPLLPVGVEKMVHDIVDQESIVAITDKRGIIVYANDRFCEISGFSRNELIGQNHRVLKSGKHSPEFYRELWRTILNGRTWKGEICNRAKDGHPYWVETVISPLRQEGLITHFIALRADITGKKEAEAALLEQGKREEEERRMLALGHLANGVLHDLNNILTGILGLTAEENTDTRNSMLQVAIGRMVQLTRTLRDYSTGLPSEPVRFRINPLLSCACSLVRFRKGVPKNLVVEEDITATRFCEVIGNEAQVFEVVLNLAVNAVEAAITNQSPRIAISSRLSEGIATITMEDNGSGVSEELIANLFSQNASSKGQGRGIGLSVAKRIALAHRGDLQLRHPGGGGTGALFEFSIPVEKTANEQKVEALARAAKSRRYILVSDDDENVRRMIENVAKDINLAVLYPSESSDLVMTATKMEGAIAAAIIDCCDLDSDQCAVARLRKIYPGIPVLLISASLTCSGRHRSPWGMVEELPKPFDVGELTQALRITTASARS